MTQRFSRWVLAPLVFALALVGVTATPALAAVSGTTTTPVLSNPNGSDFTWSCTINPDGTTQYVSGRWWKDPLNGSVATNSVDPSLPVSNGRNVISGTEPVTLDFASDGDENQQYKGRCLTFADDTTQTYTWRTPSTWLIVTSYDGDPPVAALTASDNPVREDVELTLYATDSTDPDGDIVSYGFDYGDGTTPDTGLAWALHSHTYAEEGTYTATATVTDAKGLTDTETMQIAVTTSTVFGSNVDLNSVSDSGTFPSEVAESKAQYDPDVWRLFYSGLPPTSCTDQKIALANQHPGSLLSFKADPALVKTGTYDSAISSFFACLTEPTRWAYYHEMEDNLTTATQKADYRLAMAHLIALADAHANAANLTSVIVYSDWSFVAGRNPDDWWVSAVDECGFDLYGFGDRDTDHTDNQSFAAHLAARPSDAWCAARGKPFVVPELGYDDDVVRPEFLASVGARARADDWSAVLYFDSFLNGGLGDHRLDTETATGTRDGFNITASTEAWRSQAG